MAKRMKMSDQNNYNQRLKSSKCNNNYEMSDISRILAIKHDVDKGIQVSKRKLEILEKWEKNVLDVKK